MGLGRNSGWVLLFLMNKVLFMEGLFNTISHKDTKNTKGFIYLLVYNPELKERNDWCILFPLFYTNGQ
jgi:hypothetical protein